LTDTLAMPQYKNDADVLRATALMWSARGDGEKAVNNIRAAMSQLSDKSPLVHDYLDILLAAKEYDLLLQESAPLLANPAKAPWWVYDDRARAEAQNNDPAAAMVDFKMALDSATAERGHEVASRVTHHIVTDMGIDKAVELVGPRVQNSLKWKLVAIPIYDFKGDHATALATAESAMESLAGLEPNEQDELLGYAGALYLGANPPLADQAIATYKQLLDRHPDDITAMNNLACLYAEMVNPPQPAEALKYSQRAYDQMQSTNHMVPRISDTQGWVLILNGRTDEGIKILHQVIDQENLPDAHYHLAMGYLQEKQPENAQRELDAAKDALDSGSSNKDQINATLKGKIDDALKRVNQMTGENGPATTMP